jgi:hypothetical protein
MTILEICDWIEHTAPATAIRESAMLFPLIESIHVIALTFVVGSIFIVDLRLLGVASRNRPVTRLTNEILPWTWGGFTLAAVTGLLLFSSIATRYYGNFPFRVKVVLLILAGLNMLLFHSTTYRSVATWDTDAKPPTAARVAGGVSIAFWVAIVGFGRWIGFT